MLTDTFTVSPTLNSGKDSFIEAAAIVFNASILFPPVISDILAYVAEEYPLQIFGQWPRFDSYRITTDSKCLYIITQ